MHPHFLIRLSTDEQNKETKGEIQVYWITVTGMDQQTTHTLDNTK
jgi:hypothetical protein